MPSLGTALRRRPVASAFGLVLLVALLATGLRPAMAQTPEPAIPPGAPRRVPIPLGGFFPIDRVDASGRPIGFAVYDDGRAMFNQQYDQLRGITNLGRPISQRFEFQGAPAQAFEKGILVWRNDAVGADLVNVFDVLHERGQDAWLEETYGVPRPIPWPAEPPDFPSINRRHQAVLDADPALKQFYFEGVDFPVLRHGLPMSRVETLPGGAIVRNQRTVLIAERAWPEWLPILGRARVLMLPAGAIAAEAGLIPAEALVPGLVPERTLPLVALQGGMRLAVQAVRRTVVAGRQRIEIDVGYSNRQPIRRSYNAFDFSIQDDQQTRYLPSLPVAGFVGAGTIGPNDEISGTIGFDLPAEREPRRLTFAGWNQAAPPVDYPLSDVIR